MLGLLAPTLVEPVPSMAVVRFANGRQARRVARGTRLDYVTGGQALVCLSTTMDADLAPATVVVERLAPAGSAADGLSLVFRGTDLPARPLLHAGGGEAASAELLTALARDLAAVEVRRSGGAVGEIERHPACVLRLRGYDDSEAALPVRPNAHRAHRLVAELVAFPDKFSFFSLDGLGLRSGDEVRLRFARRLSLPSPLPPDLVAMNAVPAVNLWSGPATPFEVNGRELEYPVRPDALRYRSVECHSVEGVRLYGGDAKRGEELDRIAGFGHPRGTAAKWGMRRVESPAGAQVLVHFEGLDAADLDARAGSRPRWCS